MTDHVSTQKDTSSDIGPIIVGETRIRDVDGFVGTVVYFGPVASAKNANENYAGIIWDDGSRGKHDGSVLCRTTNQVVRHFGGCGPTQGSFLRIPKLDRGVALTAELLQSKYVELQAPVIAPNNVLPHAARTSSGRDKPIEFLGELQIRQRQQLEDIHKVSLRREGISRIVSLRQEGNGKKPDQTLFENIQDVDLAGNLLSNWNDILTIMEQFPNLTDLSVAYNRIRDVTLPVPVPVKRPLDQLQVLNLNHCGIQSFQTFLWVAQSMPSLQSLCIASADLSDANDCCQGDALNGRLLHLKVLDCSDCNLSSWNDQVETYFGRLPALEQLSLDDNPIPRISQSTMSAEGETTMTFASLHSLQLAGTTISTWNNLEGVNGIGELQSLRLKNTPLTSTMGQGEARFLSIARIPTLLYFNGSLVSTKERIEAERRYVTMVTQLLLKVDQQQQQSQPGETASNDDNWDKEKQQVLVEHPYYSTLREKHKSLILPTSSSINGSGIASSLASSICNVKISSMAASSCSMEPLMRRLPGSLAVGRLKALCARTFGLDLDLMSLHFRTETDAFPVELDNDENTLAYYGVCDGAEVLMNEIDLDAKRREVDRIAKAQDDRMMQQEREVMAIQEIKKKKAQSSI